MQLENIIFSSPKAGNSQEEYEDAFSYIEFVNETPPFYRFSIADGATESSFADIWAGLLVNGYCDGMFNFDFLQESVKRLSQYWHKKVHIKDLPWYAQEKLENGAFSSLAGITLTETSEHEVQYELAAIGDSCIFHIRNGEILTSFPLKSEEEFNNSPVLISSNFMRNHDIELHIKKMTGTAIQGDSFFLMTDALACWLLRCFRNDMKIVESLSEIRDQEEFLSLIQQERNKEYEEGGFYLRNDDVTFIRVNL
ncbi:hypothetical protein SAMN04487897_109101 [Paenibacillus sp. yr247]|uniref:hypothetical protein n=1 Tax=Paenibacillus sp. yr247 TaxID=1761880 RepID=UPI0008856094|nr:hypothetical protein [Paenibacillus sp. yr247]SDO17442.1 hypothetical protein SAMN04487897_109101 [Paenibacillus sp. yr247]